MLVRPYSLNLAAWYRARWHTTKLGTLLATLHLAGTLILLALIAIWPSKDWMYWPMLMQIVDFPASLLILWLAWGLQLLLLALDPFGWASQLDGHAGPLSSLGFFWLPGLLFLALGTLWHYYWPQLPSLFAGTRRQ